MGLSQKQYVNNPIVNRRTEVVTLAAAAVNTNTIFAGINAATTSDLSGLSGILLSASTGDVFISSAAPAAVTGIGVLISSGTSLFLPCDGNTHSLVYECATAPTAMLFFD